MFKLIGVIVFFVVLVVGFPSLMRWYAGEATPKETVNEIRGKLSETLATDKNTQNKDESKSAEQSPADKGSDATHTPAPEKEMDNLQKMINEVNKK